MWFFHCHLDPHVPMGLGMVFEVESGTTPSSTLPRPPADWVGVCDAQHYAAAVEAPAPAPAPAPAAAPAPAEAPGAAQPQVKPPRAVDHKPSPTLPQRREHTSLPSDSAAGPEAIGHLTHFFCFTLLLFLCSS
uniref:LAC1 n=1 Tax=Arundo donax TaxID=35708 RepID=A0A0A9H326_ARUDO